MTKEQRRKAAELELENIKLTDDQVESLWSSVFYAYVRDQALINYYRMQCEQSSTDTCSLNDVFQPGFVKVFRQSLFHYGIDVDNNAPLYSGEGDFVSQLMRLFFLIKERSHSIELDYESINLQIEQLSLPHCFVKKGDFIKCIRDALAHHRFKIDIDHENNSATTVTLLDVRFERGNPAELSGKMVLTGSELSSVVDIVVDAVCGQLNTVYGQFD